MRRKRKRKKYRPRGRSGEFVDRPYREKAHLIVLLCFNAIYYVWPMDGASVGTLGMDGGEGDHWKTGHEEKLKGLARLEIILSGWGSRIDRSGAGRSLVPTSCCDEFPSLLGAKWSGERDASQTSLWARSAFGEVSLRRV